MESMKAWGMTDQQIQGRNNTIDQQREYFLSILYLIQFFVLISE
jgi:hypothetical protein